MGSRAAKSHADGEKEDRESDQQQRERQQQQGSEREGSVHRKGTPGRVGLTGGLDRGSQVGTETADAGESPENGSQYVDYDPGPDRKALRKRYDVDLVRDGQAETLQRLEDEHGSETVQGWASEGMTVQTMGKPNDIAAFRKRQARRSPAIPQDVERRNQASLYRNADQENDGSPAGDAGAPDAVRNVVSSPGGSLDEGVQREMESKMGGDFSDVRLHTGPRAAAAAESIGARAFTVGNHVAFNAGEYQPGTDAGKKVLAHELTHVRQQIEGRISLLPQSSPERPRDGYPVDSEITLQPKLEVSSPDDPAEKEAERVAERVMELDEAGPDPGETAAEAEGASPPAPVRTAESTASGSTAVAAPQESAVRSGVRGSGKPLPSGVRSKFQTTMGPDFSDVRVHTGTAADTAARSIQAKAYTLGSDIAFADGQYDPSTAGGKRLLAHELTHVTQQGSAPARVHRQESESKNVEKPSEVEKMLLEYFGKQTGEKGSIKLKANPGINVDNFAAELKIDADWVVMPESKFKFNEALLKMQVTIPERFLGGGSGDNSGGESSGGDGEGEDDGQTYEMKLKITDKAAQVGFAYKGDWFDVGIDGGGTYDGPGAGGGFVKAYARAKLASILMETLGAKMDERLEKKTGGAIKPKIKAEQLWQFRAHSEKGIGLDKNEADLKLGLRVDALAPILENAGENDDEFSEIAPKLKLQFGDLMGKAGLSAGYSIGAEFHATNEYGGMFGGEVEPTVATAKGKAYIKIRIGPFEYTHDLEGKSTKAGILNERREMRDLALAAGITDALDTIDPSAGKQFNRTEMMSYVAGINTKFETAAQEHFTEAAKKLKDFKKTKDWKFENEFLWDTDLIGSRDLVVQKPEFAGYEVHENKFLQKAIEQTPELTEKIAALESWAPSGTTEIKVDEETKKALRHLNAVRPSIREKVGTVIQHVHEDSTGRSSLEAQDAAQSVIEDMERLNQYEKYALERIYVWEDLNEMRWMMRRYFNATNAYERSIPTKEDIRTKHNQFVPRTETKVPEKVSEATAK